MNKRGKGRITKCLTLKDMYKYYKSICKPNEPIEDYKTFSTIIKECNKEAVNAIIYESETLRLHHRFGELKVTKYERSYNKAKHKWAIDFKATKENGFTVYFDQPYIYSWQWIKRKAVIKNKSKYKFIPCRAAKRAVPQALKQKIDYFG